MTDDDLFGLIVDDVRSEMVVKDFDVQCEVVQNWKTS